MSNSLRRVKRENDGKRGVLHLGLVRTRGSTTAQVQIPSHPRLNPRLPCYYSDAPPCVSHALFYFRCISPPYVLLSNLSFSLCRFLPSRIQPVSWREAGTNLVATNIVRHHDNLGSNGETQSTLREREVIFAGTEGAPKWV